MKRYIKSNTGKYPNNTTDKKVRILADFFCTHLCVQCNKKDITHANNRKTLTKK